MSKLNIDQKTIMQLFTINDPDFLIPDYQRPYAWGKSECQTLWDDLFAFAFPNAQNNSNDFNTKSEYFLGPIVTFRNDKNKMEIIDGQQRLTTLLLLLRAFYAHFNGMLDDKIIKTREKIAQCLWKTDELGYPIKNALKIDSDVALDDDKEEFLNILNHGISTGKQSQYAKNYQFFEDCIKNFLKDNVASFILFPTRIMNNCVLLPIEADSQDTALRIFSTLNDRGKPLSDADIFKAQFYKRYTKEGKKDEFIEKWKELDALCSELFSPSQGTPLDEAFTRYMYYERALLREKSSTTEALRKFYERNSYEILSKKEQTLDNIIDLTQFWKRVSVQDSDYFSNRVLRRLFVLNYAPNGMWNYFVSVYYMKNRDSEGKLEDEAFYRFLNKTIAFIWGYAFISPGVNQLRSPIYGEMVNIIEGKSVEFSTYLFDETQLRNAMENFIFSNNRAITRSMITWWAFQRGDQELFSLDTALDIEHIFAKNRQKLHRSLQNEKNLESLGNKAILEKTVNIRAADYKFSDKAEYYLGKRNGRPKTGTQNTELRQLAETRTDFTEADIEKRHRDMIDGFIQFLRDEDLIKTPESTHEE